MTRLHSFFSFLSGVIVILGFASGSLLTKEFDSNSQNATSRIFVDSSATTGAQNGSSWSDAFTSLSQALDTARNCGIDTILVATGTYFPTDSLGVVPADPRQVSFTLPSTGVLLGGFDPAMGITTLTDRDPMVATTILSGDLSGDDATSYADIDELHSVAERGDNAYHVIRQVEIRTTFVTTTNTGATIDGFTITGGNANLQGDFTEDGGAIYLYQSQLKLGLCILDYNSALNDGGAIQIDSLSTLLMDSCILSSNFAKDDGGALSTDSSSVLMVNISRFAYNQSDDDGGALELKGVGALDQCFFLANQCGEDGGAIDVHVFDGEGGKLGLRRSGFNLNVAGEEGGSVFIDFGATAFVDSTFFNYGSAAAGGAIFNVDSLVCQFCSFTGNESTSLGGAIVNVNNMEL
ncbi:MAG: hypothetical protein AAFQ02_12425, partial [Bacteroidota bacterium]